MDYYRGLIIKIIIMCICVVINFYFLINIWIKRRNLEISIKKALGFNNKKILIDMFFEITLLSIISLIISLFLYKSYQVKLIKQVGASVIISPFVIFFVFIILILNSLVVTTLQLQNIKKSNLCEIMQE